MTENDNFLLYSSDGDKMIKKYIVPGVLCVALGIGLGFFFFQQYNPKETTKKVSADVSEQVTFLQFGVYSSEESMKKNAASISNYTYIIQDKKYYVFVAMTQNENNLQKLKDYYTSLGYNTYAKEFTISNKTFLETLSQYDLMLKETTEHKSIATICSQVVAKYEELVANDTHEGDAN